MVKTKITKKTKSKTSQPRRKPQPRVKTQPKFGPVSTVSSAPVAIGNSLVGTKPRIIQAPDGVRIVGRDFAFTPLATGSVTGWTNVGGLPLTPACMPSSVLRNYVQMYSKFKFNKVSFHFITSSATSTTGDVVFYYQKNNSSSGINCSSNSFLPYLLSDPYTVIGPQWTNHTTTLTPSQGFKNCDFGVTDDLDAYAQGDLFLYSKTTSTESAGYIIFDYDITFKQPSTNPRSGVLPNVRAQWAPISMVFTGAKTAGTTTLSSSSLSTTWIGATTVSAFNNSPGEIYMIQLDVTNSTFSTTTASTFMVDSGSGVSVAMADGFTFFVVQTGSAFALYPNIDAARANINIQRAGVTATYAETLRGLGRLVSWVGASPVQNAY